MVEPPKGTESLTIHMVRVLISRAPPVLTSASLSRERKSYLIGARPPALRYRTLSVPGHLRFAIERERKLVTRLTYASLSRERESRTLLVPGHLRFAIERERKSVPLLSLGVEYLKVLISRVCLRTLLAVVGCGHPPFHPGRSVRKRGTLVTRPAGEVRRSAKRRSLSSPSPLPMVEYLSLLVERAYAP